MFEKESGVYEISNSVNGKRYIGSAMDISVRWRNHVVLLNSNKHHSKHLQNSWNKYGQSCFMFSVIEKCNTGVLIIREQHYIDALKPEYNICPKAGNTLGRKHTEETRKKLASRMFSKETQEKMSASAKAKTFSQEHKDNIAIDGRGRKHSLETKKKMSAWQIGRKMSSESVKKMASRIVSKETREKMSASRRAWWDRIKQSNIPLVKSEKWREKISSVMKGNKYALGRKRSQEETERILAARRINKEKIGKMK